MAIVVGNVQGYQLQKEVRDRVKVRVSRMLGNAVRNRITEFWKEQILLIISTLLFYKKEFLMVNFIC